MPSQKIEVVFSPSAQRDLEDLDIRAALQITQDIKTYLSFPIQRFGKTRLKKLTGFTPPLYRLRSGDYRIYYRIVERVVVILAITQRKDSEKMLRTLKLG
jgi:mRNA-degrading endonuclease RelE of RelBE toxin-antitoxin system